jgi:hypothetical protein
MPVNCFTDFELVVIVLVDCFILSYFTTLYVGLFLLLLKKNLFGTC